MRQFVHATKHASSCKKNKNRNYVFQYQENHLLLVRYCNHDLYTSLILEIFYALVTTIFHIKIHFIFFDYR